MYSRHELFLCSLRVLFLQLFPSLLRNSGNKHKNNPVVSAETVRHSKTYIILCTSRPRCIHLHKPQLKRIGWWRVKVPTVCKQHFGNSFLIETRTGSGNDLVPKGHQIITLISDTLWHPIVTRSLSFSISEMIYHYILINVTDIFGNKWKIWLRIRPQVTILDQKSITILMFQSRKW